jgi:hypothetical protein
MNKKTILKTLVIGLMSLLVLSSITPSASTQMKETNNIKPLSMVDWSDNFDSYTNDQFLDGGGDDGGWKGWDNAPSAGAYVVDDQALSAPYSVEVALGTDLVHEYEGYTAGIWNYTAWQYIPDDFVGDTYFILLSDYTDGAGQANTWAVQLSFNSGTGLVESQWAGETLYYLTGQWVEIRCQCDLTGDWLEIYYDGELLAEHIYSDTVNAGGAGPLVIDAVDLYANSASPVYYDDISLTGEGPPPPPEEPDLDCDGALSWPEVNAGATVIGDFQIGNVGSDGTFLNWSIDTHPTWGTWTFTPESGTGVAKGSWVTVNVSVVAPNEKKQTFTGKVKIVNTDNSSDFCEIDVSLTTPRVRAITIIQRILEKFPNAFQILRQIINL